MTDPLWYKDALCAQVDSDLFFPEQGASPRQAIAICNECPVRALCLDEALSVGRAHGVWGGKTEAQRRAMRPKRERVAAPLHCTVPGCERKYHGQGLCKWHYNRMVRPKYVAS